MSNALLKGAIAWQNDLTQSNIGDFEKTLRGLPQDTPASYVLPILAEHAGFFHVEPAFYSIIALAAAGIYAGTLSARFDSDPDTFADPSRYTPEEINWFADALGKFSAKKVINGREFQAILDSVPPLARVGHDQLRQEAYNRAFTMVREGNQRILDVVGQKTQEAIREGFTVADYLHDVNDIYRAAGIRDQEMWYTELVYNNNLNRAFTDGVQVEADRMDSDGVLWGYEWKHYTIVHPRPAHVALDGFAAQKTDPRWDQIGMPPVGHGCKCRRRPITYAEARERGLADSPDTPMLAPSTIGDLSPKQREGLTPDELSHGIDAVSALDRIPGERFERSEYNIPNRPLLNPSYLLKK